MEEERKNAVRQDDERKKKGWLLAAKIFCVFAAFCLWVYVMMVESPEHEQPFSHIPVDLVGADQLADKSLAVYNGYGTLIDVTLAGKKSVVSKLTEKDIVATADVSGLESSGRYSVQVSVDVPSGCQLAGKSQDTISVYVDRAASKSLHLTEYRENMSLPEGRYAEPVTFPVDNVMLTGPQTVVNTVERAVVRIDMTGVTKTATMTLPVELQDANGNPVESPYLSCSPNEVEVTVPVLKSVTVPVKVDYRYDFLDENSATVTLEPSEITVTGDAELVDRMSFEPVVPIDEKLDFAGGKTSVTKTVTIDIPQGLPASADTVEATVELVRGYRFRQITVPGENVIDTGAARDVSYTWDKSAVSVTVLGPIESVAKIEPGDITLVLDMSPYSKSNSGTVKVRAEVRIDSVYAESVIEVGTYEIGVTFTND